MTALTNVEIKTLNKLISVEELVGRIHLDYSKEYGWYITNIENDGEVLPLSVGIHILIHEMSSAVYFTLTDEEKFTLIQLCGEVLG